MKTLYFSLPVVLSLGLLTGCGPVEYSPALPVYTAAYYPGSPYWDGANVYGVYSTNRGYWAKGWRRGISGFYYPSGWYGSPTYSTFGF